MIKKILPVFLSIVLFICTSCSEQFLSREKLETILDSLTIETEEPVFYMYHNKLYSDKLILDFDELLHNESINCSLKEVFCIRDNKIWFVYTSSLQNKGEKWCLASVSIPDKVFTLLYKGEFCTAPESDTSYNKAIEPTDYSELNGFIIDERIILTDKNKLVEINISNRNIKEYSYNNYEFECIEINVSRQFEQLIFSSNNKTISLDFDKASKLSPSFYQISQLAEYKIYDGSSSLELFFSKVQMVNGKYYIFGRILNWHGETHMVVFEYVFDDNSLKYLFNITTYDVASQYLFVVPCIE